MIDSSKKRNSLVGVEVLSPYVIERRSKIEGVVLRGVGILDYFHPKQGQGFKRPAAPLYPNMGRGDGLN